MFEISKDAKTRAFDEMHYIHNIHDLQVELKVTGRTYDALQSYLRENSYESLNSFVHSCIMAVIEQKEQQVNRENNALFSFMTDDYLECVDFEVVSDYRNFYEKIQGSRILDIDYVYCDDNEHINEAQILLMRENGKLFVLSLATPFSDVGENEPLCLMIADYPEELI